MHRTGYIGIILLCAYAHTLWGVPAAKDPVVCYRTDGSTDTIYIHGDEYCSYRTNTRGELIVNGKSIQLNRKAIATARAPQQIAMTSYLPSQGKVRVPVILVNFSDYSFTIDNPVAQFNDFFNGKGGSNPHATGSVHDYYSASSNGALDLQYEVFGPFTLSHEMEYYGGNKTNNGVTSNHNIRAREMVTEAAQLAVDNGVDLSPYDNNGDGYIDNLSIVAAGYNEAEGGEERTIWPHYSSIDNSGKYSNKKLSGYLVISEYRSSGGKIQAGIGTYCHEFGHALGLPDLYNTEKEEQYTVGHWDIMCAGSYNNNGSTPPTYTAFERFMKGWLTPVQMTSTGMQVLEPIETSNQALLICTGTHNLDASSPNPSEYFLLENRQAVGWDAGKEALVATGLLVSHITYSKSKWDKNTFNNSPPLGFAIVSAGSSQATKSSAADVFPGSTKRTSWIPVTNNGAMLTQWTIRQIRQRNDLCISMLTGEGETALAFDKEEVQLATTYLINPVHYDTAHIELHINRADTDFVRFTLTSPYFRFSPDNGVNWYSHKDSITIPVIRDSVYTLPVLAVHTPPRKSCDYNYAFLTAETPDGTHAAQITLAGTAPRPVTVTRPTIDSITHVSTNSFSIYWEPQEDADWYYYTLYTLGEGESQEPDSQKMSFNLTGQTFLSTRYLYPPDKISMWISNNYTPNSGDSIVGGDLLVEGSFDGKYWERITTLHIVRTTKNIDRSIELDTARHWHQFRLSYTHLGGQGGTLMEKWTAHFGMKIDYLYPLHNHLIYAPGSDIVFRELQPQTTYYYAMQAYEEKGCEPHYSPLSEPVSVTTKTVVDHPRLEVSRNEEGQYIVTLPDMADGLQELFIYDYTGKLVRTLKPNYGDFTVNLPLLDPGQTYLLKYFSGRMGRKDLSGKVIY